MKAISAGLKTLLATSSYLLKCDLYTITLASGELLYFTDAPQDIVVGSVTFLHSAVGGTVPGLARDDVSLSLGLQAENITITLQCDATTRFQGTSVPAFAAAGGFDNALLRVDKLLTTSFDDTSNGVVNLFTGVIAECDIATGSVQLNVSSGAIYLGASFPRNYFLPEDNNALFSAASGLVAANFAISGSITGATSTTITDSALAQADGWFALGYVVFTSGSCVGLTRTVKSYSAGVFTLLYPLPSIPGVNDTFTAYPGYDKTLAQCTTKFNNVANFRGFPYVPTPEVLELGQSGAGPPDTSGGGAGHSRQGGGGIPRGPGGQNWTFAYQRNV